MKIFKYFVFIVFLTICLLNLSCSLFDKEIRDCNIVGPELSESKKSIFNYKVGDSILFTDGSNDFYIKCNRVIDTLYRATEYFDTDCKGEYYTYDQYIRYFIFNTNIPLFNNCRNFGISIFSERVYLLFYDMVPPFLNDSRDRLLIETERILYSETINNELDSFQLYIGNYDIGPVKYNNVYRLSSPYENVNVFHNVVYCYINTDFGILSIKFLDNNTTILRK